MENTDRPNPRLLHSELTEKVIGIFFDVYNHLGFGFLESVYQNAMAIELSEAGLKVSCQPAINVWYKGHQIGQFRADLVVNDVLLLELKTAKTIEVAYSKQTLNYLRATEIEVALILNFGPTPQFKRLYFENIKKSARTAPENSSRNPSDPSNPI